MKNDNKFVSDKDIERLLLWQRSPELFVKDIWKLSAERDNKKFIKRKNISWQQHDILLAVEKALAGKASRKISVRSGNGIGKSSSAVFIILWYLFVFKNAQVACTAPSSSQLFDVLWKEANKWISEMPEAFKSKYEWNTTHIRMTENPFIWFARAATGRKESPEALAGLHGENVLLIADESSGIPDEIFEIAEGSLTEKNTLVLLISNPTRLTGYFYETFNKDKTRWQNLHFSSLESPLVNAEEFAMSYEAKYGIDSDEYRVHVLGEFPNAESVDKAGYVSMFDEGDLTIVPDTGKFVNPRMGIDPSGEGSNETIWVVRDNFRAKVAAREAVSTSKSMALKTSTLMEHYKIPANKVFVDDFGIGAKLLQELSESGVGRVRGVNVGERAEDGERFINKRAENYMRLKNWLSEGGQLVRTEGWRQLLDIKYRRELSGRLKVKGKREMRAEGVDSPDVADALMLTFEGEKPISAWGQVADKKRSSEAIAEAVNIYGRH